VGKSLIMKVGPGYTLTYVKCVRTLNYTDLQ